MHLIVEERPVTWKWMPWGSYICWHNTTTRWLHSITCGKTQCIGHCQYTVCGNKNGLTENTTLSRVPTALKDTKYHWSWTRLRSRHYLHLIVSILFPEAGLCKDLSGRYLHLWLELNVRALSHTLFHCWDIPLNSFVTYTLCHQICCRNLEHI